MSYKLTIFSHSTDAAVTTVIVQEHCELESLLAAQSMGFNIVNEYKRRNSTYHFTFHVERELV